MRSSSGFIQCPVSSHAATSRVSARKRADAIVFCPSACCGIGRALGEDPVARAGAAAISIVRADRPSSVIREKERGDFAKKNAATAARTSSQPAARAGRSGAGRRGAQRRQGIKTSPKCRRESTAETHRRAAESVGPWAKTAYLAPAPPPSASFAPIARAPSFAKKNAATSLKRTRRRRPGRRASRRRERNHSRIWSRGASEL